MLLLQIRLGFFLQQRRMAPCDPVAADSPQSFLAGDGNGILKFPNGHVPFRLRDQAEGARLQGSGELGKEAGLVRDLVHHGEGEGEIDLPAEIIEAEGGGGAHPGDDPVRQLRRRGAPLQGKKHFFLQIDTDNLPAGSGHPGKGKGEEAHPRTDIQDLHPGRDEGSQNFVRVVDEPPERIQQPVTEPPGAYPFGHFFDLSFLWRQRLEGVPLDGTTRVLCEVLCS